MLFWAADFVKKTYLLRGVRPALPPESVRPWPTPGRFNGPNNKQLIINCGILVLLGVQFWLRKVGGRTYVLHRQTDPF